MSKLIILVLQHKKIGVQKELIFKKSLGFAVKLGKHLKSWKLVEVQGDDADPLVQYMRKQIMDHKSGSSHSGVREMLSVAGRETGLSADQVKQSFKLLPNRIRKKILGDQPNE